MALHEFTSEELERLLSAADDKTLGEVDKAGVFRRHEGRRKVTGIAGDVIEQSVLGYPADSDKKPDLVVDGVEVELKTTGVRKRKEEIHAKEPLTITAVSIGKIEFEDRFEDSTFWSKSRNLLFVVYEYASLSTVDAATYATFPILGHFRNVFSEHDRLTLEADWTLVRDKVRSVSALPEPQRDYGCLYGALRGDLRYIDTSPKWPNPPRFRLKRAFVEVLIVEGLNKKVSPEGDFFATHRELLEHLKSLSSRFRGRSMGEIAQALGIPIAGGKALAERVSAAMFGGAQHKVNSLEVFAKADVTVKTLTLSSRGGKTEDMKLGPVDFSELMDSSFPFEESSIYEELYGRHLLVIVFQEPYDECPLEENIFKGFGDLMFPLDDIESKAKASFMEARRTILSGELRDVVKLDKNGKPTINKTGVVSSAPNLPKSADHDFFMRGSSTNSTRKPLEIAGVRMYRQNWWVKGSHIVDLVEKTRLIK